MTQDYKEKLIDYVTGLLQIESPNPTDFDPNERAGTGDSAYSSNKWQSVIDAFNGMNVSINGILDNENYDIYIMYGGYQEEDAGNSKGFLIYIDEYNKPIGVKLLNTRGFQCLKFDEANNRVYGIAGNRANYPTADDNDAYFVYYNNLFLVYEEGIEPDLTYAYRIWQDNTTNYFMARDIVKHPQNSWYLIYATAFTNLHQPYVMELQINVGESNQLKTWNIGSNYFGYAFYGWYNGDTPHFKVVSLDYQNTVFYIAQDNGNNVSYTSVSVDSTLDRAQISYIKDDYISVNENEMYFVYNVSYTENGVTKKQSCLYLYNGTSITTVYKTSVFDYEEGHYDIPMMNVVRDSNTIYALRIITDQDEDLTTVSVADITQHSTPQESDFLDICDTPNYVYRFNMYNFRTKLNRNFNIVYFNSFCGYLREGLGGYQNPLNGFSNQYGTLVYKFGYTGYPYSSYNVLVPRYVNMYFLSIALMFSRNVYNITRFENTTTASVEIPAKYLNNYTMSKQKLFGATAYTLVGSNTSISKNKYEVVHTNFINTINVIDEDTNITYKQGAIKLNNGSVIGTQNSYNNSKCTKYRINYNDNTTATGAVIWTSIDDTHKETTIIISVNKEIDSIDLLSGDETTTYMTIKDGFEIGKYYSINQKVRVE